MAYVQKPWNDEELLRIIRQLLDDVELTVPQSK
jgi:hypothetical protein